MPKSKSKSKSNLMAKTSFLPTLMFLLLFSTFGGILSANSPNISTDQSALRALKSYITHDPHNFLTTNWSSSTSVCNWIGVTCGSKHRRVTALDLSNMDLTGTIHLNWEIYLSLPRSTFVTIVSMALCPLS
ncbi:hypothetical protein V6N11_079023 [Hibiscus sabdariffa]|uniref:Leucine-rich repeat-containing N-terminal plant-type domain-containing protein n=1 Tax=Hibiscus sabdariffa TaxID=183260 RepID=A0ABR2RU78_9ROSI